MRSSVIGKIVTVALITTVLYGPALEACTLLQSPSPPVSQALVYDYHFDESCSYWGVTGDALINGDAAFFDGPGEVYQDIVINTSYSSYAIAFGVTITGSSPGLERLRIEIGSTSGTIYETVEVLSGNDADGRYDFDIGDYDNQTIRLRLRRLSTNFAGDTEFSVDWINIWGRY